MTGYTVHTGASKKFVTGWDRVFGPDEPPQKEKAEKAKAKGKPKKKSSGSKNSKRGKR